HRVREGRSARDDRPEPAGAAERLRLPQPPQARPRLRGCLLGRRGPGRRSALPGAGAVSEALVLVERDPQARIATVLLNRPGRLHALSERLMGELVGEMVEASAMDMYAARRAERWDAIRSVRTPLVAAVSGYCLGGGCELAMSCDLIVASESAVFGQPETGLGIIPGAGGTQRLTRAVGKSLAMDVVLSGRRLSAREALAAGLVARVVAREAWLEEARRVAREIAAKAPVATRLAKEAVNRAFEAPLALGLDYERRLLYLAFASEDAREGLAAFVEKRPPDFAGR